MQNLDVNIPVREPAPTSSDDSILPFEVAALDLRGRIVRLGPAVDAILTSHDYPLPVAKLLGEAIVLTVMLGSALKFDGRFILQTQSDGPVRMLVVDFASPDKVRACARFDAERVRAAEADGKAKPGKLLGKGHLAMTIDQGPDMSRYQGLVPLEGNDLEHVAHEYFLRSEQIPTRVRLAVAEEYRGGANGAHRHWRAGGILAQFLPKSPERARQVQLLHRAQAHRVQAADQDVVDPLPTMLRVYRPVTCADGHLGSLLRRSRLGVSRASKMSVATALRMESGPGPARRRGSTAWRSPRPPAPRPPSAPPRGRRRTAHGSCPSRPDRRGS